MFCTLLVVFHRPLLLSLGHRVAVYFASRENLKLDFRIDGNPFGHLTVRNLHISPTGPSDIESIDIDLARADYRFFTLIRHGPIQAIRNLNVQSGRIVLNPAKTPLRPRPPRPEHKVTLPDFFPDQVNLSDVTVIVRNQPHDFVMEHVSLDLDPRNPGELRIGKLQLVGGQTWSKVSAHTAYANKNLILRDLVLATDEQIRSLTIDASRIAQGKLGINLDYPIQSGHLSATIGLTESQSSIETDIHVRANNVPAGFINKYATLPEDFMTGQIAKLEADVRGLMSAPRTWNGTVVAQIDQFRHREMGFDQCTFRLLAGDGKATLEQADVVQGDNQFRVRGAADLPANVKEFGRSPLNLEVTAAALDLQRVTAGMPQRLTGSAQFEAKVAISGGKLDANINLSATTVGFENGTIEKATATLKAWKNMPAADSRKPWYADLRSETVVDISKIRFRDNEVDQIQATLSSADSLLKVERLSAVRKQNELALHGEYELPIDFGDFRSQRTRIELSLNAPELGDYWVPDARDKFTGSLQGNGQIQWKQGIGNGQLSIFGSNVRSRDLVFRDVSWQCSMANSTVYVNDFTARLNERDFANGYGTIELREPFRYSGKISANVADLSTLKPMLHASGNENELAGSFVLNWEGSGDAKTFKNTGQLRMVLENARYGDLQSLESKIESNYSPEGFNVPIIFFGSNKMNFQAIAQTKGETLEITQIQLDQGEARYAQGYISIPFIWKHLGTTAPLLPPNGKVTATFQSENVDIKKLFENVGMKAPASGVLNVKLDAQGTVADLDARLAVDVRDLRSETLTKLQPASFSLTAEARKNQLNISGQLQQAQIQPLELTANLPFDLARISRDRKMADNTPIKAKLHLPRSSINFVRQFAEEIQQMDGEVALDVDVTGTLANPVFAGSGDMTINVARSDNTTLPALSNFKARVNFARDVLTLEQFAGELSGGKFTMGGRVTFPKLTSANLDLQFKAESILVARSDSLTARTDADIKIVGPLTSATVTGNVAVTNSRFLKNLDLIPIGLPGRPTPQPPASRPEFSFPQPPFRDWKFDVAIKTKDPFLISGNLASGKAISDLHLTGTGLHPGLDGVVRLENVEATLPFSRMEVQYGFLYFDPSDSLNPKIDLHGTSVVRDYTIHVYVYGNSLSQEAIFTSEPPLPQEEIISLLATGTTREELTGNNNVLAGRAAMLLFQQLYRKVFKKGEATKSNSAFDRLDLDVGRVDPRTGQQTATARFRVNKNFVLIGDLEVGGDFRGLVKYVIRFR